MGKNQFVLFLCNGEFHTRILSSRDTGRVPDMSHTELEKDPTPLGQQRAKILNFPHLLPYKVYLSDVINPAYCL